MAAKRIPAQAINHTTLKGWLESDGNISTLKDILAHPVFIAATHYALKQTEVTEDDLIGPKPLLAEVIQRKASVHAGGVHFVEILKAFVTSKLPPAQLEEWGHIQPPIQ